LELRLTIFICFFYFFFFILLRGYAKKRRRFRKRYRSFGYLDQDSHEGGEKLNEKEGSAKPKASAPAVST
jgi:hypothetical protein